MLLALSPCPRRFDRVNTALVLTYASTIIGFALSLKFMEIGNSATPKLRSMTRWTIPGVFTSSVGEETTTRLDGWRSSEEMQQFFFKKTTRVAFWQPSLPTWFSLSLRDTTVNTHDRSLTKHGTGKRKRERERERWIKWEEDCSGEFWHCGSHKDQGCVIRKVKPVSRTSKELFNNAIKCNKLLNVDTDSQPFGLCSFFGCQSSLSLCWLTLWNENSGDKLD